ncbi:hypothetical protein H633G_05443 [Metarhizium anisopliae BRIP 53284]|nr:hypothetical protein H633G_05443 [Metarhizium anisopliae BRIP 53284]
MAESIHGASPASSHSDSGDKSNSKKRASAGEESSGPQKVTKRRAARACVSCRARKVRCDVVEGAPCGNCRWDNVECIVQESRRRKKNLVTPSAVGPGAAEAQLRAKATAAPGSTSLATPPLSLSNPDISHLHRTGSVSAFSSGSPDGATPLLPKNGDGHVPHMLCKF